MKLSKREEKALLRVREQENIRSSAHCCSEIADNCMDSSEESSGIPEKPLADFISQKSLDLLKELHVEKLDF
ncbi:hypothetical protein AVEN_236218-1 [Araneus ventricosus]|uniref:Uncharacterized protein n=1 Tax=Araneus ventricosus TaxID=182803 RepID=A0A4Y2CAW1_ARAVE|nr:hypothetical protein AVEN_236218-1 [Araneus ventricosus]